MAFTANATKRVGEAITLSGDDFNNLGPDLVLEDCEVTVSAQSRDIVVAGLHMVGGAWIQKKKLTKKEFSRASFENVRFEGRFTGITWGDWHKPHENLTINCDFSKADLDDCRFLHIRPAQITLPPWPCVAVVDPHQILPHVEGQDWPGQLKYKLIAKGRQKPACTISVDNANQIAKTAEVELDTVRAVFESLPGALIRDD